MIQRRLEYSVIIMTLVVARYRCVIFGRVLVARIPPNMHAESCFLMFFSMRTLLRITLRSLKSLRVIMARIFKRVGYI